MGRRSNVKRQQKLAKKQDRLIQRQQSKLESAAAVLQNASPPPAQAGYRWEEPQADKLERVEQFDAFAQHRNALRKIAAHSEEWAGLPCGIEGEELVIEPSYAWASVFAKREKAPPDDMAGVTQRNHFWSRRLRKEVYLWEEGGKFYGATIPPEHTKLGVELRTLGCSVAWGIEQESTALKLLAGMVRHHTFKHYLLTGMFLETSPRSGITYLFRKLKPTLALTLREAEPRILAGLCMHPVGFYRDSWAGAMCPTDDIIAHLSLMRGDEHMLWRRANHHSPDSPLCGL